MIYSEYGTTSITKGLLMGASSPHVLPVCPLLLPSLLMSSFSQTSSRLPSPRLSLAASLACDGPEAAMLSSPFNLPLPLSQALTLQYSAQTLSVLQSLLLSSPSCHHFLPHTLLLLLPFGSDPYALSVPTAASVKDTVYTFTKNMHASTSPLFRPLSFPS